MTISRRALIKSALASAAAVHMPVVMKTAHAKKDRIVVRDLGIGTSFVDAYGKAFTEATGIEVVPVTAQHEPAGLIRQMVETRTYTWDMAIVSSAVANELSSGGKDFLEPLRIEQSDVWQTLPEMFKTRHYAANDVVATVLAYRNDKVKSAPTSWRDYWDTAKFPGSRALRRFPFDTLEQALLADGVLPADLYPLDFPRALRSLDKLRSSINVWWTSGAQTSQLLISNEVDYCPTWNGRAQVAIDAGAPVSIMWDQALWQTEGWVVLKGTPKADLCREFIKFALQPQRQAIFATATGYGPTVAGAVDHIEPGRAKTLPTHPDNMKSSVLIDFGFWGENKVRGADLFNNWIIG